MTAGYTHYLIELFAYMLITYLVGCLLGAAWRKMFAAEPVPAYVAPAYTAPEPQTPVHVPTAPVALADVDREQSAKRVVAAMAQQSDRTSKPQSLTSARGGKADDLQEIVGIGPKNEQVLHSLGIYHFDQIANWTDKEIAWVEDHMQFDGRIAREEWIRQARLLADGNHAEFQRLYGDGKQSTKRPSKPKGLSAARGGKPDDLQRISGIGPKNEKVLHSLGFFHFDQIAEWTAAEVNWVDDHLNFNGRIAREEWIKQAQLLADGKEAEFARLYGTGGQKGTDGETLSGSRTRKG